MSDTVSLHALKALVEKKTNKKTLVKVIWNEQEKLTLFIIPNMKIQSFIYDEKEGYMFYDQEGKPVTRDIPLIVSEKNLADGKVLLGESGNRGLLLNHQPLTHEDRLFLQTYSL
ncbi:hypothetical protein FH966_01340 [Lentibacillus cibarius]|uniref:Uncharacterized protein n=1 Tax=Lentibacillus cibarius TaxID=2583219 RepID=A0A549YF04_9BACI|nr:hypothetical protein [Lentibacillus cibarius]TMN21567.1 hypothetical protein FFL34_05190 [Lentibacillus cibarius]TRM10469.1 hypothetical protein FH966_01340 [Lentibacillus cibarius]